MPRVTLNYNVDLRCPVATSGHGVAVRAAQRSPGSQVATARPRIKIVMSQHDTRSVSQLILTLEELIEALDRRMPLTERAGETEIAADAHRLRACAMQRIALLHRRDGDPIS